MVSLSVKDKPNPPKYDKNSEHLLRNIPSKYFISLDFLPERIDGNGKWELDAKSKNPFEVQQIELKFAPTDVFPLGFDSNLYMSVGGKTLFGGIDDNVLFTRDEICK